MPRYDEQEARAAIAAASNWSEALRLLGLRAAGGNFALLKRWAAQWGIDASHFRPYEHAAEHLRRDPIPLEDILVERLHLRARVAETAPVCRGPQGAPVRALRAR